MFPLLQPHRPQLQQPRSPSSIPHQQVRAVHVQQQPSITFQLPQQPPSSLNVSSSLSSLFTSSAPQHKPTSQIDTMTPVPTPRSPSLHLTPPPPPHLSSSRSPPYDPSTRHPVFFTQNLRKPPFPIRDGSGGVSSPVAFGYVIEREGKKRGFGVRGKL